MANHMGKIAKMLGVKIEEEFKIGGFFDENGNYLFKITLRGLEFTDTREAVQTWKINENSLLQKICRNDNSIIKLWPKEDDKYYFVDWDKYSLFVNSRDWYSYSDDFFLLKLGNCFRTEEEAEKNKYRIYRELTGKEWSEELGR